MNGKPADAPDLSHVTEWIFDLDNTLYPRHCDLFGQIDVRMTDYVSDLTGLEFTEARRLQKQLYRDHGTTLRGLMHRFNIDPRHFLDAVHDIDYTQLQPNERLAGLIQKLPGRKPIFTNGDVRHAENTLKAIGISGLFDEMFDIVAADYEPKPARYAYDKFLEAHRVNPRDAVMFEDMPRNLEVPKSVGMATVLIVPARESAFKAEYWEHEGAHADHIDHVSDDIDDFLGRIVSDLPD